MVHTKEAVLMLDTPSESGESCVLGSTILRSQIVRVQFCSKMPLEVCQEEMWDVSAAHDRSILAWAKKVFISSKLLYELYIASDTEYSRAAEPPVQCGVSHLSRRTEPHCL